MSGSSRLLMDEHPLTVQPSLVVALGGLNRAVFLQQLHYWLNKPGAHQREGQPWIYNTFDQWHEQFPFWKPDTIRKLASSLQKDGIIKTTARFNERKGDRTLWYTIDYDELNRRINPAHPPDPSPEPPADHHPDESPEPSHLPEDRAGPPEDRAGPPEDRAGSIYTETNNRDSVLQTDASASSESKKESKENTNWFSFYCELAKTLDVIVSPEDRQRTAKHFQDLVRLEKPTDEEMKRVVSKMLEAASSGYEMSPQKALGKVRGTSLDNVTPIRGDQRGWPPLPEPYRRKSIPV